MRKSSCKSGQIKRASYSRKAHERKSYSRKSSGRTVKVKSSYVGRTKVPATCVPAKGKALSRGSKTPTREKILPEIGKEISLRKYGYATNKNTEIRHNALLKASNDLGDLKAMRHLILIRNYQADPKAKEIMSKDVKFLSIAHA